MDVNRSQFPGVRLRKESMTTDDPVKVTSLANLKAANQMGALYY
jgi:hypothetical protein